jgi:hypothetical protein
MSSTTPTGPTAQEAIDARKEEIGEHLEDHGHSGLAWGGVGVVVLGTGVAAVAVIFALVWLFWVGMGVAIVGGVVWQVLERRNRGQRPDESVSPDKGTR